MVGKAESRIKKATWYGEHIRSYTAISKEQAEVVLLGDSIVANLARYPAVWDHLEKKKAINCGIRGDQTQNVLWRVENMYLPATVAIGIIHCGVNDINGTAGKAYRPQEIAENVISCGFKLRQRHPLMSIIIAGILPAMETNWGRKSRIVKVNEVLKGLCSQSGFRFIEPDESWVEEDGCINQNLFWRDGLHLNKKGCTKLKDLYVEAINASMCGITQSVPKDKQLPLPTFIPPQIDDNSYQHDPPRKPLIKIPSSHQCHNRPKSKKKKEKVLPIMSTQSKQPEPDDSTKKSVNNDPDDEKMDIKINKSKCYMFGLKFCVFFVTGIILFIFYF